ncbi:MAG: CtsR family transcriptional regulator [Syntrophomonadaceae bacterium]|jgi:transcriptional regulator CtsR
MSRSLADRIEQYLSVLIERSEDKQIEIQRAELAETFQCAPSQVTYVITTRFTEKEGYITESRRGGKGFVRITKGRKCTSPDESLQNLLNLVEKLTLNQVISHEQYQVIRYLILTAFSGLSNEERNKVYHAVELAMDEYQKRGNE